MITDAQPGLLAFGADAPTRLRPLGPARLERFGTWLASMFGRSALFSTVYDGPRPDPVATDLAADLQDLGRALGTATLARDPVDRDRAAGEPAVLAFIRQCEGKPAAIAGVLRCADDASIDNALAEARALGFDFGGAGSRRLALLPPPAFEIEAATGRLRLTPTVSHAQLETAVSATPIGLATAAQDLFATPFGAALAGLHGDGLIENRHGQPWAASVALPPGNWSAYDLTWAFRDAGRAAETLHDVVRTFQPLLVELIPGADAQGMAMAGLWRGHQRFDEGGAALRVMIAGAPMMRRVAMLEASWMVERRGGVVHHRGAVPDRDTLTALAVASGAARLETRAVPAQLPAGARIAPRLLALRGRTFVTQVMWYPRDLAHSLAEAAGLLGLEPAADPAAAQPILGRALARAQ